jgi:SpoVK/Ycf46/Vps4 family AAA+-type ATPase
MRNLGGTRSFLAAGHKLIAARVSLVWVPTWEEDRLQRLLEQLIAAVFPDPVPLYVWTLSEGLVEATAASGAGGEAEPRGAAPARRPDCADPEAALRAVLQDPAPALYLFKDLHRLLEQPRVARRLRDAHRALDASYSTIFLSGPELRIPTELTKQITVLELPPPDVHDLEALFSEVCSEEPEVQIALGEEHDALLRAALGLTEDEARLAFRKLLLGRERLGPEVIPTLLAEKRTLVRREGVLDYVEPRARLQDVGGLDNLKAWLRQRRRMLDQATGATAQGGPGGPGGPGGQGGRDGQAALDLPRGLLVTGISGCGKSYAVKAVASFWRLPLLRLDMNRVYAAVAGTPEQTLERAIHTAEAVAPCVLWIDEIETALLGTHGEGGSQATRIFSSFLTWMQEKEALVFVAATANEIDKLPPEILRKGRFDQVFFVDLPDPREREEILSVHLRNRGLDPAALDVSDLARSTNGFSGAELEQLVIHGMYAAFGEQRAMDAHDLYAALAQTVPLSRTMMERIKAIKRWADTRAVRANG